MLCAALFNEGASSEPNEKRYSGVRKREVGVLSERRGAYVGRVQLVSPASLYQYVSPSASAVSLQPGGSAPGSAAAAARGELDARARPRMGPAGLAGDAALPAPLLKTPSADT